MAEMIREHIEGAVPRVASGFETVAPTERSTESSERCIWWSAEACPADQSTSFIVSPPPFLGFASVAGP